MRTSENFNYQTVVRGKELLVTIQGDLDMYTVSLLQEVLSANLRPDISIVTLDCDKVKYVDSAFLQFVTRTSSLGFNVRIKNASRTIRKIFAITGLDKYFIYDDEEESA